MTDNIYEGREIPEEERKRIDDRVIEMEPDKFKFYEDLRRKAKNWNKEKGGKIGGKVGEYLFLLPDFFILLTRLMVDKRVSVKRKLMIGGIVAYVMLPLISSQILSPHRPYRRPRLGGFGLEYGS